MKKTKLIEDIFIISWLLVDTFWIFDQLVLAILAFLLSTSFCCFYGANLIKEGKDYSNAIAALLWLVGNGFWVTQDLLPFIPTYIGKISILSALTLTIILAFKNKLNNPKTNYE